MAVTDAQFLDHANQNNAEFGNRRIVIKKAGVPGGSDLAPKYAICVNTLTDLEYINLGTITTPSWSLYPDLSAKEDVGAAQAELRASVPTAGDDLNKLYNLITSLGSGLNTPIAFDASAATYFPSGVSGDAYIVVVAGTVDTVVLNLGDLFWTNTTTTSGAGSYVDWFILPLTSDLATETIPGLVELATQAEAEATSSQSNTVVLTALRGWQQILAWWTALKTAEGKDLSENNYDDAAVTKLAGIEAGATADQTGPEIEALYEAQPDTKKFTDSLLTKLTNLTQASEEVTRFDWTITGHSFSLGDPIAFDNLNSVFALSVSANDDMQHLGFVTSVIGDVVTISLNGLIDITGWGLAQYTRYYLDTDGTLITTDNGFPVLQTISTIRGIIIARGTGGTGTTSGASSTPYYIEGVFDGSTNQVDLGQEADDILVVSLGGDVQRRTQFTIDDSGANTVIIFEDSAAALNGLPYNIIFINNAVFGDITFDWSQILNNPIPASNLDETYYLRPSSAGGYELAVLPSGSTTPNLQAVTAVGATTTLPITTAGLTLSNYSTRAVLYVDTDGGVKQATFGTGLSITAGGQIQGAFLPLAGGIVTGNVELQGTVKLTNILSGGGTLPMWFNTTTKLVSYGGISIDNILDWGNLTTKNLTLGGLYVTDIAAPSAQTSIVRVSDTGRLYTVAIGTNLSLDLIGTTWTLNASGGSGGVTITGTPNRISKFNGTGNNVIDSQIYDDGTNIGMFLSPIAGAGIYAQKANTTTLALLSNTATTGDVLQTLLPSGGSGTQNFLRGHQGATERYKIDIAGKAWFQNLNIALGAASTLPLQISSTGNVSAAQVNYLTQISNLPTIPAAQVNSDWNATSGLAQILNRPPVSFTVIEIGAWDMDADISKTVYHGITEEDIRGISVIILSDGNAVASAFGQYGISSENGSIDPSISGSVTLTRVGSGQYDSVLYNDSVQNRGYITIMHI